MTAHKHAAQMLQYAQDALETETPWERWEVRAISSDHWSTCVSSPGWNEHFDYRRKPKTISINGFDVPEPLREAPEKGTDYWPVTTGAVEVVTRHQWCGNWIDQRWLARGLIHATKYAAEAHAKALLSFTAKEHP